MPSIDAMRQEYSAGGLSEAEAGGDPFVLFRRWFEQAVVAGLHEPNAFALATSTPEGLPSVRLVLLKLLDERGFTFFTNFDSRKGREMAANPSTRVSARPLENRVAMMTIGTKRSSVTHEKRPIEMRFFHRIAISTGPSAPSRKGVAWDLGRRTGLTPCVRMRASFSERSADASSNGASERTTHT